MSHPLHHVALGARSVEALAGFYADTFALTEVARHHDEEGLRSVWLQLGAAVLMVERCAGQRAREDGVAPGWFLLAFDANGRRAALREALSGRGVERESKTAASDYYRDPEGNRFAVSEYDLGLSPE